MLTIRDDAFHRITGAFRLSSGQVVVANGGTYELRLYNAAGRFVSAVGRRGGGPGEFEDLDWAGRSHDTIVVADGRQLRVTSWVFGAEPSLAGIVRLTARSD